MIKEETKAANFLFKRILVINIFGVGDVLFTTPILNAIRKHFPDCFIGYLCNKRTAPMLSCNPHVDKIFVYEKDEFRQVWYYSKVAFAKRAACFLRDIKKRRFDLVIDVSLNTYANYFMWFLGIKRRVGFNYKNRSFLLTDKIPLEGYEDKHVVEYYCGLLEYLGVDVEDKHLQLFIRKDDTRWAQQFLKDSGVDRAKRLFAIVPGGGASWGKDAVYKRWPAQDYANLADKVVEKFGAQVILIGDTQESGLCARVAELMRHKPLNVCGKTSIGQCAALFKACAAAVVNDGGPLHIAVASGMKTVSVFGPVDEAVYGPYPKDNHVVVAKDIACRPCYRRFKRADCEHHNCINKIGVDVVVKGLEKIL